MCYRFFGLVTDSGISTSSPVGWDVQVGSPGSQPVAVVQLEGGFPICPGQEPDPSCDWRQCEAELHSAGWGEAMHRDRVRRAAALRVP
jgi:hypothetical protein